MSRTSKKFGGLLNDAINRIRTNKRLRKGKIIDDIAEKTGYTPSTVYRWVNGIVPDDSTLELLIRMLFEEDGLNCEQLPIFLKSVGYGLEPLYVELCGNNKKIDPVINRTLAPFAYHVGIQHPRQFFGRKALLAEIFRMWRNWPLQCGAIIGNRRSGKTALLEYVRQITTTPLTELRPGQKHDWLPKDHSLQWVFVDFQEPGNLQQKTLLENILTRLGLPIPDPCNQINFNRLIGDRLQQPTIFLMDEFDKALASEKSELDQDFWEGMRALVRKTKGKLGFLVAALTEPEELAIHRGITSPFFNIFLCLNRCVQLGPFDEAVAREMIDSSPIPFAEQDKRWIMEQSDCWPHKLQICCYHRLAALEEGRNDGSWRDDALAAIERF